MQNGIIDKTFWKMLRRSRCARRVMRSIGDVQREPVETREFLLAASGAAVAMSGPRHIRVTIGQIWLTQEGELRDVLLSSGQDFACPGNGKIVIQALEPSLVRVEAASILPAGCNVN